VRSCRRQRPFLRAADRLRFRRCRHSLLPASWDATFFPRKKGRKGLRYLPSWLFEEMVGRLVAFFFPSLAWT